MAIVVAMSFAVAALSPAFMVTTARVSHPKPPSLKK
jgi:hypothetical protein